MPRNRSIWLWVGGGCLLVVTAALFIFLFSVEEVDIGISTSTRFNTPEVSEVLQGGELLSHGNCSGNGPVTLTHSPMELEDFSLIIPYGLAIDGHVTPIDHQYFSPADWTLGRDSYNVYAMANGKIVDIRRRLQPPNTDEYRLVFMHSCTFFTYYDLVTSLTPELQKIYDEKQNNNSAILDVDIKGGQLIGKIGGQTLDFAVWNTEQTLDGYIFPEHYNAEPWKVYTGNPYQYYSTELLEMLMTKTMRTAEPIEGKIDHDIEGALQGVWFVKGTNWYGGNSEPYWTTHLSISPDHWDPTGHVFSIGDYDGEAAQFGLSRNSISPVEVTIDTGLVKYELFQYGWSEPNGSNWDRISFVKGVRFKTYPPALGTVLVQVLENNELQVEVFPGKTLGEVSGFTSSSTIYER